MSGITTGVGLFSGINFREIVDQLITIQRTPAARMESRVSMLQQRQTGFKTLEANLLTLTTSATALKDEASFQKFSTTNTDAAQLSVSTDTEVQPGNYHFRSLRMASTHETISKGFSNADQQTVGTGTLTISQGGNLVRPTQLDVLNSGNGFQRGSIRITDRSGAAAEIDLTRVQTVNDVLQAINGDHTISVNAFANGDHLTLVDTSGHSSVNLTVEDVGAGTAATDLGLAASVAESSLTGQTIYQVTGDFSLDQINDGNGLYRLQGAPDLRITLTNDATLEVNLDDAFNLDAIVNTINNHEDNSGKVTAALVGGRLQLTDTTGGGGSSAFQIEDINGSSVTRQLGLDTTAASNVISGRSLVSGINTVLIRNLRGGAGVDELGELKLTDRAGRTSTLDLKTATSLTDVVNTINAAEDTSGTALSLTARVNDLGTGILIQDTSGATASNLKIADVGSATLATQLGIAVDAAVTEVDSGNLAHRYINEASSLAEYAADGGNFAPGEIRVTDSQGKQAVIQISSAVATVGDFLTRINAAQDVDVTAELNDTGDGFVLIDQAGGSGDLKVEDTTSTTAADLRILGTGVDGSDGKSRISSREAMVLEIDATDTLQSIVEKINNSTGHVQAAIVNDGSSFTPHRLTLTSTQTGAEGRFMVDDGNLDLGLTLRNSGHDALLQVGADANQSFYHASTNNTFNDAVSGMNISLLDTAATTATITVTQDTDSVINMLNNFTNGYNALVDKVAELTRYDTETNERGVLQAEGGVLRMISRLESVINRTYSTETPSSLYALGLRMGHGGKLSVDSDQANQVLAANPQAVADFFSADETGFAATLQKTLDSFTDPLTGTLSLETEALQNSVDQFNERIEQLDAILLVRRDRLLREFINMENAISALSSQQNAIGSISTLSITPRSSSR